MPYADTQSAKVAMVKESTFGVNPATGASFARITSESLIQETETVVSEEVTGDSNPRELIRTSIQASGDINFEFTDNNFDQLLEASLSSTFGTAVAIDDAAVNITSAAGGAFTLVDANTTGAIFGNVVAGQWLRLGEFNTNGVVYARVVTKTDNNNVDCQGTREDGTAVTNESGQTDISVYSAHLKLGTTKTSFTIERQWTDISVYDLFTGMNVSSLSMTITPGSVITGTASFLGKLQDTFTTSQIGTTAAAGTEKVVNAVDHVDGIMEGAFTSESSLCITEISFTIDSSLRGQTCVGVLGLDGVGYGVKSISGTLTAFLEDKTLLEKYLDFTDTKLAFRIKDADGNVMIFTFPSIKFSSGQDVISSNAADGLVELEWTAQKESGVSNSAMTIDRMPTAPAS